MRNKQLPHKAKNVKSLAEADVMALTLISDGNFRTAKLLFYNMEKRFGFVSIEGISVNVFVPHHVFRASDIGKIPSSKKGVKAESSAVFVTVGMSEKASQFEVKIMLRRST